jgi:two-component system LytT family sensor kinase
VQLLLIILLVKLGVATAVGSVLGRTKEFKKLLFKQNRSLRESAYLVFFIGIPFALGVYIRCAVHWSPADLGFEASILMGMVGGRFAGCLGGALLALPATAFGEYLTLPVNVTAGVVAGVLRHFCRSQEEIWTFSPFIDLSIYRWMKRILRYPRIDWQTSFFLIVVALQAGRLELRYALPKLLFANDPVAPAPVALLAIFAFVVATMAVPIKVWNNARIEMKLEEQERLLLEARLDALQSQVNPHFLFNTLNSISSLVRFDPDRARELIVKLSKILRRQLGRHGDFVPLREEIEFIDDYLDIEVVRFGRDKLHIHKELAPETLDVVVPIMLLQPLVENSVKHGLAPKVDGGSIILRSRIRENKLVIQVEDDGVGMNAPPAIAADHKSSGAGIGMMNIAERLHVLFGDEGNMTVQSRDTQGTQVTLELPVVQQEPAPVGGGPAFYALRPNTRS